MAIPSGLLGKGLFGLCLVGSGTGGWIYGKDIVDWATGVTALLGELNIPERCKARGEVCKVKKTELLKVLFKNKSENDLSITGLDTDDSTIDLKIEKGQDPSIFTNYPHLKFTIIHDKDLEIQKSSSDASDKITVKKNTNTEFKVNNEKKLEKAWTVDSLAKKAGLKECKSEGKKCTIEANKAISYSVDGNETKKLTLSADDESKITYEEDQAEYNQGFKFIVGSTAVTGTGTSAGSSEEKLEANTNYEVKYDTANGWYLSKKDNTAT